MGPHGIMMGESLGVVARLLGDPGEDQTENLPVDELRLWPESYPGDGCSSWSGVAGRYWYGLRVGMASGIVSIIGLCSREAVECSGDAW